MSATQKFDIVYPSTEDEPVAESELHFLTILQMVSALRFFFRARTDWFIIGNLFWYYEEGNVKARLAPDLMLVKGVNPYLRRTSFRSWEEGAIPCMALEVLSDSTGREDLFEKMRKYEELGVREYFLLDPHQIHFPERVVGFRLHHGKYIRIAADTTGAVESEEFGVRFGFHDDDLVLTDVATGESIPGYEETGELLIEARLENSPISKRFLAMQAQAATAEAEVEAAIRRAQQARALEQEACARAEQALAQAEQSLALAEQERARAEQERVQAEQERARAKEEHDRAEQERVRGEQAHAQAEQERVRAEQALAQAEQERARAEQLAAELAALRQAVSQQGKIESGEV